MTVMKRRVKHEKMNPSEMVERENRKTLVEVMVVTVVATIAFVGIMIWMGSTLKTLAGEVYGYSSKIK